MNENGDSRSVGLRVSLKADRIAPNERISTVHRVSNGNQPIKNGVYLSVRLLFVFRLAAIVGIAAMSSGQASACKCATNFQGKNHWEVAKLEADWSAVVFEGTPENFELQWEVLDAKDGELISADESGPGPRQWPKMVITFRVQTGYKGDLGPKIKLTTGLGGGDCGAVFAPGLVYLLFAGGPNASDLRVSMCSPGGWIGERSVATELRYLRKERPTIDDLAPFGPASADIYAARKGQRQREWEEYQKRRTAATGKICGTVSAQKMPEGTEGTVSFLSTIGYSPVARPTANVNADGSFCSEPLGPGRYYLYFVRRSEAGVISAGYYPGVSEGIKATTIEVEAGRTQSGIRFEIPFQKTYSVRGVIFTDHQAEFKARSVDIALIGLDATFPFPYSKTIDFQTFYLPKIRYFVFENVLPGRYVAHVSVPDAGWLTKKVEVDVTGHMKFVSLELIHKQ